MLKDKGKNNEFKKICCKTTRRAVELKEIWTDKHLHLDQGGQFWGTLTCSVGRSMKTCRSSRPGLSRALSKMSARLVDARTMTWSVVPIPEGQTVASMEGVPNTVAFLMRFKTQDRRDFLPGSMREAYKH